MRHRTRPVPRLNPEAPDGTPEATSKVATNELAKPILVSRGGGKKIDADRAADQAGPINSRSAATISVPR
jgi:hypothetical protein